MAKFIGLAAIFSILPIGESISFWNGAIGGYFLAGVIAVTTYLFYGVRFPSREELRFQLIIPVLCIIVWSVISLAWCPAISADESIRRIVSLLFIVILLHVMFDFVKTKDTFVFIGVVYSLAIILFIGGTVVGLTPWEYINREGRLTISISEGYRLNENNVGNQAATAVIVACYLFFAFKNPLAKLMATGIGVAGTAILIASGSRGSLVGLIVGFLVLAFCSGKNILTSPRKRKMATLGILSVMLFAFMSDGFNDMLSDTTMGQRFDSEELTRGVGGRFDVIVDGINYVFVEGNLLGKGGIGAFLGHSRYYVHELVVHCMPVAMLADLGIVGLLLYGFVFWQVYRNIKWMPNSHEKNLCLVLGVFVWFVTSKGGGAYYAGWTWCILGLITTIGYRARNQAAVSRMATSTLPHDLMVSHSNFRLTSNLKQKARDKTAIQNQLSQYSRSK